MYEQSSNTPFEDYHAAVSSTKWACETSDSELSKVNYLCLVNFPLPSTYSNRKCMAYLPLQKQTPIFCINITGKL